VNSIASTYRNKLKQYGVAFEEDGTAVINKDELGAWVMRGETASLRPTLSRFADAVYSKSSDVASDPMQYTDRILVAYKGKNKGFLIPYVTNSYSGMYFDSKY